MELPESAFTDSVLIVAHPDDEVLWFSSILDKVSRIVICYLDEPDVEGRGDARRKSLAEHEYRDRIVCLGLDEVNTFGKGNWPEPEETDYGLMLRTSPDYDGPYRNQATILERELAIYIKSGANIYTHSPWGEYGHEDHIQVSRIVTRMAGKSDATIWYSNYASNHSMALMTRYVHGFDADVFTMPVDANAARQTADTYYRNGAWTWLDDYVWFENECFVMGPLKSRSQPASGAIFPINFVRLPLVAPKPLPRPAWLDAWPFQAMRRLRRLLARNKNDLA